jgi:hypothetical protein
VIGAKPTPTSRAGRRCDDRRSAMRHGLPADSVYHARYHAYIDVEAARALATTVTAAFAVGRVEPAAPYVLRNAEAFRLAAAAHDPACDLLAEVDGLRVLAPGWLPQRGVPPGVPPARRGGGAPRRPPATAHRRVSGGMRWAHTSSWWRHPASPMP